MPTRAKRAAKSGDYVVAHGAINVLVDYEDLDGSTKRRVRTFDKGTELTADDLKHADVERLLSLGAIREASEDEEEEEPNQNPSQGAAATAAKVPESEGAKVPKDS